MIPGSVTSSPASKAFCFTHCLSLLACEATKDWVKIFFASLTLSRSSGSHSSSTLITGNDDDDEDGAFATDELDTFKYTHIRWWKGVSSGDTNDTDTPA